MSKIKEEVQTIEQLTKRFRDLETEKTRVQTLLGSAKDRLEELLNTAEAEFGTRDVGELESRLKELETENTEKRQTYQKDLDSIESRLGEIEEQFVDVEIEPEDEN